MQILNILVKDDQDLVRLYMIDAIVAFITKDTEKVNMHAFICSTSPISTNSYCLEILRLAREPSHSAIKRSIMANQALLLR